jgi:hypothetical protein
MYTDNYTELLIKDKTAETDVERKSTISYLLN